MLFLRIVFPLSFFFCGIIFSKQENLCVVSNEKHSDSLKLFSENYLPQHLHNDEIIKHIAYSLSYNENAEQANWVAYKLTSKMCDNNGEQRKNNFREDKDVKTGSAVPDDYKKSGYDRGHLCPAGDMGWSEETMSESFFMSNMSPQKPKFNRGIWKQLETDVRNWAKENEELYIVTAGVLEKGLPTIGLKNKVEIPQYYYKIVLDLKGPEYKAIAFVLPNKESKEPVFKYAVTIDSVERLTHINFFPALPDSLENNLESHINIKLWE